MAAAVSALTLHSSFDGIGLRKPPSCFDGFYIARRLLLAIAKAHQSGCFLAEKMCYAKGRHKPPSGRRGPPMTSLPAWPTRLIFGLVSVVILAASAAQAQPRHGIAMHGEPKYPADFQHFGYVNPNAPKGGRIVFGQQGSGRAGICL
jgi:hypothetical protein